MRWFFFLVAVLALWGGLEIAYWRQTGAGDTLSGVQAIAHLFLIPIAFVGTIYISHRFIKWLKKKREDTASTAQPESQNTTPLIDDISMPWLHVHRIAVQSHFKNEEGNTAEQLQTIRVAAVDPELKSPGSNNLIVSRRILDLSPEAISNPSRDLSDRGIRIQAITEHLLSSLEDTFGLITENMVFNQLMSAPLKSPQQQALLHPAWTGAAAIPDNEPSGDTLPSSWSKLSLQIVCLLADHLGQDDQEHLKHVITQHLEQDQLHTDHIQITHQIVKDADACLTQFNEYCSALASDPEPRMLLLIGADSTLDQAWLELRGDERYTPAEAGFALLLSNDATVLPDFPTIAHISAPIWAIRQKPVSAQGTVGADALIGIIDELSHRYKMPDSSLIPETGVLITDNSVTVQSTHSEELTVVLDKLKISTMKKIAYAGMALEQSNTMVSGVTLALAVQYVLESQQHTLVLCSGGERVRTACLVTPQE